MRGPGGGDEARDVRHTRPARAGHPRPERGIQIEAVEGTESVVELSASPELEEEARIELRPKRDGHELSVIIEKRNGPLPLVPRGSASARDRSSGERRRRVDRLRGRGRSRCLRRHRGQHGIGRRLVREVDRRRSGQLRQRRPEVAGGRRGAHGEHRLGRCRPGPPGRRRARSAPRPATSRSKKRTPR